MGKADVREIERRVEQNRLALATSLIEVRSRLEPRRLVGVAVDKIGGKTAAAASEASQLIKDNGGKAALFGAGLLLAFTTGRKSSGGDSHQPMSGQTGAQSSGASERDYPSFGVRRRSGFWDTAVAVSSAVAAGLIGYVVSGFVPVTDLERKVLGDTPAELKSLASAFIAEHGKGAKQFGAQSFGIASMAATALALLAGFAGTAASGSASAKRPDETDAVQERSQ